MQAAVHGLLLAAGAGRSGGGPKVLRRHPDGTPWAAAAVDALWLGGLLVLVVLLRRLRR